MQTFLFDMNPLIYVIFILWVIGCKILEGVRKWGKKCWFRKLAVCYCLLLLSKPCTTGVSDSFEAPIISPISEIHCVNSKKLKFVDFLLNLVVWISLLVKNFTAYLCLVILSVLHEKYWMLITVPINNHQNIII